MSEVDQNTAAQEERKFLHDISSPLSTTLLYVESILETVTERCGAGSPDTRNVQKVLDSVNKAVQMIHARRAVLIREMETESDETLQVPASESGPGGSCLR